MEPTANTAGLRFYSHIAPITTQRKQKKKKKGGGQGKKNKKVLERKCRSRRFLTISSKSILNISLFHSAP